MGLVELYDYCWNQKADPRTNNFPLVASPIIIPSILISYLAIILKYGPEYMKDKKPYDLRTFLKCYNVFQIITNAYLIQQLVSAGLLTEISFFQEVSDFSSNPDQLKICYVFWIFTMIKLVDLSETVVFILRKKNNQASALHLYHHVSTVIVCWFTLKFAAVATTAFSALTNCFIHVIMYTYYLLSSFGEREQKMLKLVKPFITTIQMVQFVLLFFQNFLFFASPYSQLHFIGCISIPNLLVNFYMFYNFYKRSYKRAAQKTNDHDNSECSSSEAKGNHSRSRVRRMPLAADTKRHFSLKEGVEVVVRDKTKNYLNAVKIHRYCYETSYSTKVLDYSPFVSRLDEI